MDNTRKQLQKAHYIDLKNQRAICIQESVEFVKRSSLQLNRLVTKEIQRLVKQFIKYRSDTTERLALAETYHRKMKAAEAVIAHKNPVLEAEYHINNNQILGAYDTYVPSLKQYLRAKTVSLNTKLMRRMVEADIEKKNEDWNAEDRTTNHASFFVYGVST